MGFPKQTPHSNRWRPCYIYFLPISFTPPTSLERFPRRTSWCMRGSRRRSHREFSAEMTSATGCFTIAHTN